MKDLLLYFAVVAFSGACFLPLHIVSIRAMGGGKLITTLVATIAASAIVGGASGWFSLGGEFSSQSVRIVACVGAALTFVGFAGAYSLIGPISVDRSVSSHIVELVSLAPGGRLKEADLFALYTHADLLDKRFHDCIETGIIERRGEELVVTPRGAKIAFVYLALGKALGMRLWYLDRHGKGTKPTFQ